MPQLWIYRCLRDGTRLLFQQISWSALHRTQNCMLIFINTASAVLICTIQFTPVSVSLASPHLFTHDTRGMPIFLRETAQTYPRSPSGKVFEHTAISFRDANMKESAEQYTIALLDLTKIL